MIGQTISHYKILEKLGEGGMGVVYKAHDTKLDRVVALKFLPQQVSASQQDRARFIQEAKAAAALNHPNICTIHDIQEYDSPQGDTSRGDKQMFIVMEFVDGQTLREKKGTLSYKQAIDIGIQIADGLAAAHEKGIVHRDIKPENIMIRKDGIAQIMDFGLAKLRASGSKITRLTKEGSTVGTAGYMSPEQVQGQEADHRSDIFSYGVLLYEMITGQLPFKGVHETAMAYEIVNVDALPMSAIKPDIDPALDAIVLECLEKDVNERAQSMKQIAVDLKRYKRESSRQKISRITATRPAYNPSGVNSGISQEAVSLPGQQVQTASAGKFRMLLPWSIAVACFIIAVGVGILSLMRPSPAVSPVTRAYILPPPKVEFSTTVGGHMALSPDGQTLAFVGSDSAGHTRLWVRPLRSLVAQMLEGTDGATYPFWSPDNRYIAFFSPGKLKKIEVTGGPALNICDASSGRGGSWNKDGVIIFAADATGNLSRVSAEGGTPVGITQIDSSRHDLSHRWPYFLPDGNHFLYYEQTSATGTGAQDAIRLGALSDMALNRIIVNGGSFMVYANGYLVYQRQQILMAQRFDPNKFECTEEAVPIVDQVQFNPPRAKGIFSMSQTGTLVYQSGVSQDAQLTMFSPAGVEPKSLPGVRATGPARFSSDGQRVAFALDDAQGQSANIWTYEISRQVKTRLTFGQSLDRFPIWSPDDRTIVYSTTLKTPTTFDIYQKNSDGTGKEESLVESSLSKFASDWSPDGRYILYTSIGDPRTKQDIWVLPMSGERKPYVFLRTEFIEADGKFSPDMRWVAYRSDESGQNEIYVRPFQDSVGKWQISVNGGTDAHWNRKGTALYFASPDGKVMVADVKSNGRSFQSETPRVLFEFRTSGQTQLSDVTADGSVFLASINTNANSIPAVLVTDWTEELKKK